MDSFSVVDKNNPTCSSALASSKKKDVHFEVAFLTSEYVCVSGCNSFDLDNARLCSLGDDKRKLEVYIQYNSYPSNDADWLSLVAMTTGQKLLGLGCTEKQQPRYKNGCPQR